MLAKILGAYSIGYRNTKTGNSKRQDVIIMENLLYGHKSAKVQNANRVGTLFACCELCTVPSDIAIHTKWLLKHSVPPV